jgi:hypothetical protein
VDLFVVDGGSDQCCCHTVIVNPCSP